MSSMSSMGIVNPGGAGGITASSADVLTNKTIDSATNTLQVNGQSALAVSTAYTNATTSLTNVPGLSFAVQANKNYLIACYLTYSVDTSTATPNFAFTGPASPTSVMFSGRQQGGTTIADLQILPIVTSAFGTPTTNSTGTTISTNSPATIYLTLQNGANAGTVQLQAKANGAGTLTVVAGSMALIHQA